MIDSSGTFVVAYVLVAVIYVGYSVSLWSRARKVKASFRQSGAAPHQGSER